MEIDVLKEFDKIRNKHVLKKMFDDRETAESVRNIRFVSVRLIEELPPDNSSHRSIYRFLISYKNEKDFSVFNANYVTSDKSYEKDFVHFQTDNFELHQRDLLRDILIEYFHTHLDYFLSTKRNKWIAIFQFLRSLFKK